MSNKYYEFASVFAVEIAAYLALRESQGRQHLREWRYFVSLDRYLINENQDRKEIPPHIVEGWLQSLSHTGMSVNTKIVYISHFSQFAKYLKTLGFSVFVPERPIDDKSYAPYVFSKTEMEQIFISVDKLCDIYPRSIFVKLQFPILLRILYGCGLRLEESLGLQIGDYDEQSGVLLLRNAKGNKDRIVPIDDSLAQVLNLYILLIHKNNPKDMLLFANRNGDRNSGTAMRYWFNKTLEVAGIEKPELSRYSRNICLNCLRHTFAVHSFRKQDIAGIDMYSAAPLLSTYMGHAHVYGTEKYLHMAAENSEDIIEKMTAYAPGLFPEAPR